MCLRLFYRSDIYHHMKHPLIITSSGKTGRKVMIILKYRQLGATTMEHALQQYAFDHNLKPVYVVI
jgi:hypothetical protein